MPKGDSLSRIMSILLILQPLRRHCKHTPQLEGGGKIHCNKPRQKTLTRLPDPAMQGSDPTAELLGLIPDKSQTRCLAVGWSQSKGAKLVF